MRLKQTTASLWGKKHKFTPYVVDRQWGDGKQFIALSPMFIRPYFYVVRIHSTMDLESAEWLNILDEVYDAIDEQFGPCCEEYSESGECECDHYKNWPSVFQWGGSTWWDLTKKELLKLGLKADAA